MHGDVSQEIQTGQGGTAVISVTWLDVDGTAVCKKRKGQGDDWMVGVASLGALKPGQKLQQLKAPLHMLLY